MEELALLVMPDDCGLRAACGECCNGFNIDVGAGGAVDGIIVV